MAMDGGGFAAPQDAGGFPDAQGGRGGGGGGRGFGGDRGGGRGGFRRGGRGGRGRGRGRVRGRGRGRGGAQREEWVPVTKLGRLVKNKQIKLEEVYLWACPIKEAQIIEEFLPNDVLQDEVLEIKPVQKQTNAGQRTRFRATVVVGDHNGHVGHVGLGQKASKEVATAIRGAITAAKLRVIPVRRGYWGRTRGDPHTIPCQLSGRCGSVLIKLIPAARGCGIVAGTTTRKLLEKSGIRDVFTKSTGSTRA